MIFSLNQWSGFRLSINKRQETVESFQFITQTLTNLPSTVIFGIPSTTQMASQMTASLSDTVSCTLRPGEVSLHGRVGGALFGQSLLSLQIDYYPFKTLKTSA